MKNLYLTNEYIKKNPSYHIEDSPWKAKQILKMLKKHNLSISTICEVGCGVGEILISLQNQLPSYIQLSGYEISNSAYKLCKKKENNNLKFYLKNISNEDKYYDLILLIDVIEHVEDIYGLLKKVRLKGKYKIFHIPLDLSFQMILRKNLLEELRENLGHIHYFTKEIALATLKDSGYKITDYFYTNSGIELESKSLLKNFAKFPRKILASINKDLCSHLVGGLSLMVLAE